MSITEDACKLETIKKQINEIVKKINTLNGRDKNEAFSYAKSIFNLPYEIEAVTETALRQRKNTSISQSKKSSQSSWQCSRCNKRFLKLHTYFHHLKQHNDKTKSVKPKFYCLQCPEIFHRALLLKSHVKDHHKDIKHHIICKHCNKVFSKPHQYFKHRKMHNQMTVQEESLQCKICDKVFAKGNLLKLHEQRIHDYKNEVLFCKFCDYKSRFKMNIERHTKLHFATNKQFVCHFCGGSFTSKGVLTDHINYNHEIKEKQFKCEQCNKSFKRNSELVRHMSSHSNIRPYACNICKLTYKRISHLKRHELTAHSLTNQHNKVQRLKTVNGAIIPVNMSERVKSKNKKESDKKDISNMQYTKNDQCLVFAVPTTAENLQMSVVPEKLMNIDKCLTNEQSNVNCNSTQAINSESSNLLEQLINSLGVNNSFSETTNSIM